MKVSEIYEVINDCDRLRDILLQVFLNQHTLTELEIQKIRDLLWDYGNELLAKEVK